MQSLATAFTKLVPLRTRVVPITSVAWTRSGLVKQSPSSRLLTLFCHSSSLPCQLSLKPNRFSSYFSSLSRNEHKSLAFALCASPEALRTERSFHSSGILNEWHEKRDENGKQYWQDIYSKEISFKKPEEYLALKDQDSPMMRFFRTDTFAERGAGYPAAPYWLMVICILIFLWCLDMYYPDLLKSTTEEEAKRKRILGNRGQVLREKAHVVRTRTKLTSSEEDNEHSERKL